DRPGVHAVDSGAGHRSLLEAEPVEDPRRLQRGRIEQRLAAIRIDPLQSPVPFALHQLPDEKRVVVVPRFVRGDRVATKVERLAQLQRPRLDQLGEEAARPRPLVLLALHLLPLALDPEPVLLGLRQGNDRLRIDEDAIAYLEGLEPYAADVDIEVV